jgi:phosphoglycolate phosphatase-like HAD superfamily hydrolase
LYAVLFDIDGTLVQTGGAGQLAFAETFAAEYGVPQISAAVSFAGRSDRAIALDLFAAHGIEPSDVNWRAFRAGYLQRLPDALKRKPGRVLPGVAALLDALDALPQSAVGLLTGNVREGAATKLGYYGLGHRFAFGGFGDDTNDRCEIAAIALAAAQQHAAERNGGRGEALWGAMVIGDTIHDIRCARAIGAVAVAVPTGGATKAELAAEGPDILVDDLSDPSRLLEVLREARAA